MNIQELKLKLANWRTELPALRRKFDKRPTRERAAILFGVLALTFLLMDRLWLDSALRQFGDHRTQVSNWQAQRDKVAQEMGNLKQEAQVLQQAKAQQVEQVRKRLAEAQEQLRHGEEGVVSAQDMLPLLQQLMQKQGCPGGQSGCNKLRIRAVKSIGRNEISGAVAAVSAPASAASAAYASQNTMPRPGLWRHGIELTIEGSYADLTAYVQALENLPQRLLRGGMSFQVEAYPKSALTLRLYTLSLDPTWLEI